MFIAESAVEDAALDWFREIGYQTQHGPEIAPDTPAAERSSYQETILIGQLRSALSRINPGLSDDILDDVVRKIGIPHSPSLVENNQAFHRYLVNGVPAEIRTADGRIAHEQVWPIDFDNPANNDFLAVNQFTVIEGQFNRRADLVIFINGLPLAVIELKNPADMNADIRAAFRQLQTYKQQIPALFACNEILAVSDGTLSRFGSLTAAWDWYLPWRTINGDAPAPKTMPELEVLIKGLFDKQRLLEYLRHFIVFDTRDGGEAVKKIAGYHQFHAVKKAVETTVIATRPRGDKRCGVVWHTQGSGKSLSMVFFAGEVILREEMENPTLVILTDRNDLDGQLFDTFSACRDLLRQQPKQAENREHLQELLQVSSGGVVFTTIQKFFPETKGEKYPQLSDRRNIVVIADEAHRSQYDFIKGFARHMRDALPNASFIGFTGTPIEHADRNTPAVFGDYIDIYDIEQAVRDDATVPIYYESRLARLELDESLKKYLDDEFDEVTEDQEATEKERLKTKWAALEAVVGAERRIEAIAKDLVEHFEKRLEVLDGKAMIVCMSRRICIEMYDALIKLRPEWHDPDDKSGTLKVVMTGSASDKLEWQPHIRNKQRREELAKRFRKPGDPFRIVIVRDMWLTGFDAPSLHTMYIDKPMRGHGLMQAIARVNRKFRDKPGGLVVDYIGFAQNLKKAMAEYTASGGKGKPAYDPRDAVAFMLEKYERCAGLFHGFPWEEKLQGSATEKTSLIPEAVNFILGIDGYRERLKENVNQLSKAFALAVPQPEALERQDAVGFFQTVNVALSKSSRGERKPLEDVEFAIRQIVSRAVASKEILDIFEVVGLERPDISILSDEFLAEVKALPQKNLAVEMLRRLLEDEIKSHAAHSLVQSQVFSEMLEKTLRSYHNRSVETLEVIEELLEIARKIREDRQRGVKLGLTEDELAFYDALGVNDSAVKVLGDDILCAIARELTNRVHKSLTIDWQVKESARAMIRVLVKNILRKFHYPPDKQESAVITVLRQTELISTYWAA